VLVKAAQKKTMFLRREEVGFKFLVPAAGSEEDREVLTRTRMYFRFLSEMSFLSFEL